MDAVKERALHKAVRNGEVERIRFLLEQGVYVNATDAEGKTPFDRAFLYKLDKGDKVQVCEILEEYGANLSCDILRTTPLHSAVSCGKENIVKLRLENGADVNAIDHNGDTPLHLAAREANLNIIRLLLEKGADIIAANCDGDTPLHLAARKTNLNIIRLLLEKGADIKAVNCFEETPLHEAVQGYLNEDNVKLLIECGAEINARDSEGSTPLHCAVNNLKPKNVIVLLAAGADVNATTKRGETALDSAMHKSSGEEVLELICHFIVSLQVAGLYVSGQNIQTMSRIRDRFSERAWYLSFERKLDLHKLECGQEVERMKTKLRSGLSLMYIFTTNNPRYLRNEALAQQLDSINYDDFPIYGNLLKRKLETDKKELLLLEEATKAFGALLARDKRTTQLVIPSELLEKILCHLRNSELRNLISCTGPN